MSEIFQNSDLLETLKIELQQIDEIIIFLTRNMKRMIEKLKRQFKDYILNVRTQEFDKMMSPLQKTKQKFDFILKKLSFFFDSYNKIKPDLDITLPNFCFNQINIDKSQILTKCEQILSQFSFENFANYFQTSNLIKFKDTNHLSLSDLDKISESLPINNAHKSLLKSIAFLPYKPENDLFQESPNSFLKILVTCDINSTLFFRNWQSRKTYEEISNAHSSPINELKIIKDKQIKNKYYVVSGGDDGFIKLWDMSSNYYSCVLEFKTHDSVNHIDIIPNFKYPLKQDFIVTIGDKNQIKIWDWSIEKQKASMIRRIIIQDSSFVFCFKTITFETFIFDHYEQNTFLITGFESGKVSVWDWKKKNPLMNILNEDFSAVRSMLCIKQFFKSYQSFIKTNNFYYTYAIGYLNGSIKLHCAKGKLIKNIRGAHEGEISALESLPVEGKEVLISGGRDKFIRFWKWRSGEILKILCCEHRITGYDCLKVGNVFDTVENKEKYILISGGRKINDICQVSIWKY